MIWSFECESPARVVRIRTAAETSSFTLPLSVLDMADEEELFFLKKKLAAFDAILAGKGLNVLRHPGLFRRPLPLRPKRRHKTLSLPVA